MKLKALRRIALQLRKSRNTNAEKDQHRSGNKHEASRELKSLMSAVPILMFTLFSESELGREAKAAGVDKVIAKSDSPAVLIRSIHGLLAA